MIDSYSFTMHIFQQLQHSAALIRMIIFIKNHNMSFFLWQRCALRTVKRLYYENDVRDIVHTIGLCTFNEIDTSL